MHVARVAAQIAADVEDGDEAARAGLRGRIGGAPRRGPRVRGQGELARPEQAAADVVLGSQRLADDVVGAGFLVGGVGSAEGLDERDLRDERVQRRGFIEWLVGLGCWSCHGLRLARDEIHGWLGLGLRDGLLVEHGRAHRSLLVQEGQRACGLEGYSGHGRGA